MMITLIRKELRSVLPYILLVLALTVISLLVNLLSSIPHLDDVKELFEDFLTYSYSNAISTFVLYFALMASLFNREYDDKSVEFLDALPTTRLHVFAAKIFAAWIGVVAINALDVGVGLLLLSWQDNSLLDVWNWSFIAIAFLLRLVSNFIMIGWASFFSMWRSLGWLVFAVLVMIYLLLIEAIPSLKILDFVGLGAHDLTSLSWHMRWPMILGHIVVAIALYICAYVLFRGATDRLNTWLSAMRENFVGAAALMVITGMMVGAITIVAFIVLLRYEQEDTEQSEPATFASWGTAQATTRFYQAVYLTDHADAARQLLDQADTIHEGVRTFFGADEGNKIFLDMSGPSRHAGVAFWNHVIIDLTESPDPDLLKAVLAHETAHVYLDRLSDSRLSNKLESTRFFHEGVASYVEWRIGQRPASRQSYEQCAAIIHARNPVRFEQLVRNSDLSARYDTDIVYPLGQVFAAAVVDVYGDDAIPKLAKAFVRPDAPQSIEGLALWQDTFQACRMNLENVIARYQTLLDELVQQNDALIQSLPRLQATVSTRDANWTAIRVTESAPEDWAIICRVRRTEKAADRTYQYLAADETGSFYVLRTEFDRETGWYQLGLANKEFTVYEPWRTFPLKQ